jgi:hypothetical protein
VESQDFKAIQIFLKSISSGGNPAFEASGPLAFLQSRIGKNEPTLDDVRGFVKSEDVNLNEEERRSVELSIRAVEIYLKRKRR